MQQYYVDGYNIDVAPSFVVHKPEIMKEDDVAKIFTVVKEDITHIYNSEENDFYYSSVVLCFLYVSRTS